MNATLRAVLGWLLAHLQSQSWVRQWSPKLMTRALDLEGQGRVDSAIDYLTLAASADLSDASPLLELGRIHRDLEDHASALAAFERATRRQPREFSAWLGTGLSLHDLGDHRGAIFAYLKALDLNDSDLILLINLAGALRFLGRLDEAIVYYDDAVAIAPDDAYVSGLRGSTLYDLGRWSEAIEALRRAVDADPDDTESILNLALSLASVDGKDAARALLIESLARNPGDCHLRYTYAWLLVECDDQEGAVRHATQAAGCFAEQDNVEARAQALTIAGWAHYRLGALEESLARSGEAVALDTGLVEPCFNAGLAALLLGRRDEALEHYLVGLKRVDKPSQLKELALDDLEAAAQHLGSSVALDGYEEITELLMTRQRELSASLSLDEA